MRSLRHRHHGSSATSELTSLLSWVLAARVIVGAAGVIAVSAGLLLVWRGRRIEGVMMGAAGVAAAVTAEVVVGYVAWRAHTALEQDVRGAPNEDARGRGPAPR